jgi:hypothetical protein
MAHRFETQTQKKKKPIYCRALLRWKGPHQLSFRKGNQTSKSVYGSDLIARHGNRGSRWMMKIYANWWRKRYWRPSREPILLKLFKRQYIVRNKKTGSTNADGIRLTPSKWYGKVGWIDWFLGKAAERYWKGTLPPPPLSITWNAW